MQVLDLISLAALAACAAAAFGLVRLCSALGPSAAADERPSEPGARP